MFVLGPFGPSDSHVSATLGPFGPSSGHILCLLALRATLPRALASALMIICMIKTFTVTLPVQERAPCNSYFTVWDKRTRDRGTVTFTKKFENADLKILLCTGCHNEIGEVDAWYGVKCSCGDLVVPGYQILKVVFPPSFVPNFWLVSRQLSFTVNSFRDLVS